MIFLTILRQLSDSFRTTVLSTMLLNSPITHCGSSSTFTLFQTGVLSSYSNLTLPNVPIFLSHATPLETSTATRRSSLSSRTSSSTWNILLLSPGLTTSVLLSKKPINHWALSDVTLNSPHHLLVFSFIQHLFVQNTSTLHECGIPNVHVYQIESN